MCGVVRWNQIARSRRRSSPVVLVSFFILSDRTCANTIRLKQSYKRTFRRARLAVIENLRYVVVTSIISVTVSQLQPFPVLISISLLSVFLSLSHMSISIELRLKVLRSSVSAVV